MDTDSFVFFYALYVLFLLCYVLNVRMTCFGSQPFYFEWSDSMCFRIISRARFSYFVFVSF